MKYRVSLVLVVILLCSFCVKAASASVLCSPVGYSIYTINGINTDIRGAQDNKIAFQNKLKITTYNNQPLTVDFLYNPTHLLGLADIIDYVKQGFFDQKLDYDLEEMLNDASQKVTTQKVLLVAHSQGNFYANNFYDKIASQPGGVPSQSIGVYSVATPAGRVAGGGRYLTSDTDQIIASLVGGTLKRNILSPNVHIAFQKDDDPQGHDFSKVYLKYQGAKIVSDIKASLDTLKTNDEQDAQDPCLSPPELTTMHKIKGVALNTADFIANGARSTVVYVANEIYGTSSSIAKTVGGLLASVAGSAPDNASNLTAGPPSSVLSSPAVNIQQSSSGNAGTSSSFPNNSLAGQILAPQNFSPENLASTASNINSFVTNFVSVGGGGGSHTIALALASPDETQSDGTSAGADTGGTGEENSGGGDSGMPTDATSPADTNPPADENPPAETVDPISDPTATSTPDTILPVITILGDNPASVVVGTDYVDAGATALDDVDGVRTVDTTGTVDTTKIDTYTITYTAQDLSNNIATANRMVNVIASSTPPTPPAPPLITTTIDRDTTLLAGEYTYDNLVITNNATLFLVGNPDGVNSFKGVKINAVNIIVDAGAHVSADAKGYGRGSGPGVSTDGSVGASYGGLSYNGVTNSMTYGSAIKPLDLGSGGNNFGGGAIYLDVSDTFTDNGAVSADGEVSSSGGSIYVATKNIAGSGIIRANGGSLYGNGYFRSPGGGGRVALYYQNSSFSGSAEAKGGCGIYSYPDVACGQDGTVGFFDSVNDDLYINSSWRFIKTDEPLALNNIYVSNGATVEGEIGSIVTANNLSLDKNSTFTLAENQTLNIPNITVGGGSTLALSGSERINTNNLLVTGNSYTTIPAEKILSLTVPNITIDSGSVISAYAKGYSANRGPGASVVNGTGASYGGTGYGGLPTPIYGSETDPTDFGSGGAYSGGGAIKLNVSNILKVDGEISADGNASGSGGSININTDILSGSGKIHADGGGLYANGYFKGPGGGGRVAIYYQTSSFSGTTEAKGGCGYYSYPYISCGEDGTVYIIDKSKIPPPPVPVLSADKAITAFDFSGLTPNVVGVIDETKHTISLTVPFETDVAALVPTIVISDKAKISPDTGIAQDFTNSVNYTITAEDDTTQDYTVAVEIANDPNPVPDITAPTIASYALNGTTGDLAIDPSVSPLNIVLTASENVNWITIQIIKQNNTGSLEIYKKFQPGRGCDGGNICSEIWRGELSAGGVIQSGDTYKIKVHMEDLAKNDYEEYLPSVITITTSNMPNSLNTEGASSTLD